MNKDKNRDKNKYVKNTNYNLFESFRFAFEGIVFALFWERNLRIHLSLTVYLLFFSVKYYKLEPAKLAILVLAMALVVSAELFNTAIEKTVDLATLEYSPLAKIAKDVAAAAVLATSIGSLIVGLLLLWNIDIIKIIGLDILKYWYIWVPVIIISLAVIFLPELNRTKEAKK